MKCPVCDESLDSQVTKCPECGFNQLHREFLNQEELDRWIKETVEPCDAVATHLMSEINVLLKRERDLLEDRVALLEKNDVITSECVKLRTKNNKLQKEYAELEGRYRSLQEELHKQVERSEALLDKVLEKLG